MPGRIENTYPLIAICRHRIGIDGDGVTTLVGGAGCPLSCRWCLNRNELKNAVPEWVTAEELLSRVKQDDLYFRATGGGITFGGGEPLLYPSFIRDFCLIRPEEWHINIETSLSVPKENVEQICKYIDMFIVDCKDMNDDIYRRYTGGQARCMKENLSLLVREIGNDRIIVRVPIIPEINNENDRKNSINELRSIGIKNVDMFTMVTREK